MRPLGFRRTFGVLNITFALLVIIGVAMGKYGDSRGLYLILLFPICSLSLLWQRRLNDRYALLSLFFVFYFVYFGVTDFTNLWLPHSVQSNAASLLTMTEIVVLIGGALVHVGYRAVVGKEVRRDRVVKDWAESTLVSVGLTLWVICTVCLWYLKVFTIVAQTNDAAATGFAALGRAKTAALLVASMVHPLSIVILAYAAAVYKRTQMLAGVAIVVLAQLVFGFIVDVKADALMGLTLVVVTKVLVDGKIPRKWMLVSVAFVAVAFPVMQANRWVRGEYNLDRTQVAANVMQTLKLAIEGSNRSTSVEERAESPFERLSLKNSVDLLVSESGKTVPYQYGHTLSPLVTFIIPRVIWPSKPDVQAGQLMNRVFHISNSDDTYISPSNIGELYWNFGWYGVVFGMTAIGFLLGFVANRCDLAGSPTLTNLMVIAITIKSVILGFEGAIAVQYVVWLRSLLAVWILHMLFARVVRTPAGKKPQPNSSIERPKPFSNILR